MERERVRVRRRGRGRGRESGRKRELAGSLEDLSLRAGADRRLHLVGLAEVRRAAPP